MVKNPYETLIPKGIPYWVFWPLLGWILLGSIGQVIGFFYGKSHLPITRLIAGFVSPFLPVTYIWLHKGYGKTIEGLSSILWKNKTEFSKWLIFHEENIFTLKTLRAKLFTGLVLTATVSTVAVANLNFISVYHHLFFVLWGTPILFLCSHGCYILFALLTDLYKIVRMPAKIPFFMLPNPSISELQNYFSSGSVVITVFYIILAFAFYETFYIQLVSIVWLSFIGLYPLSLFIWSIFQVHELMKRIKQNQYEEISKEVDRVLKISLSSNDIKNLNRLEKLLDIQKKVQSLPEWPINFQGIFTFAFTLVTAGGQVAISIYTLLKK